MNVEIGVEYPRGRVPICLIVDDPCPCINPLYYFRLQVDRIAAPPHVRTIPLDFLREFARWTADAGVRGDFTVLPYPAGFGRIDRRVDGFDDNERRGWIDVTREWIAPRFDIHPEILTHTLALDLDTARLRDISEHEWMDTQDEETLARYFTEAMRILVDAGLPNHGLTQPCTFRGDEAMYARAILAAEKTVNSRKVTHNFLHVDLAGNRVAPRITLWNPKEGEAVVSVWSGGDDIFWITQDEDVDIDRRVDLHLTPDGRGGRFIDLLRGGGPIVFHTHWQSLYSNGRRSGLAGMKELARRVEKFLLPGAAGGGALNERRAQWRKLSELATYTAAKAGFNSTVERVTTTDLNVHMDGPFECAEFTVRVSLPWLYQRREDLSVSMDGEPLSHDSSLREGSWRENGAELLICFPLKSHHSLSIQRR